MSHEMPSEVPIEGSSRRESLLRETEEKPERFNDLDASMLLLEVDHSEFRDAMRRLGKQGRSFELIFALDDPDFGADRDSKIRRLRQLKAIREDRELQKVITSITVKGKKGEQMIEPNVFSSDVKFEEMVD